MKNGADVFTAADFQPAVVSIDNFTTDPQAQPCACHTLGSKKSAVGAAGAKEKEAELFVVKEKVRLICEKLDALKQKLYEAEEAKRRVE